MDWDGNVDAHFALLSMEEEGQVKSERVILIDASHGLVSIHGTATHAGRPSTS